MRIAARSLWFIAAVFVFAGFTLYPVTAYDEALFLGDHFAGFVPFAARAVWFLCYATDRCRTRAIGTVIASADARAKFRRNLLACALVATSDRRWACTWNTKRSDGFTSLAGALEFGEVLTAACR